jgi:UDP-N-acetylmuramoylalanine--D-glutamate ligase
MDIAYEFGSHRMKTFLSSDVIILSPGVPHTIPPIAAAREKGIPVMGELELASRFISDPIVAVTGTNGKTTTTKLVGDMLVASGQNVFVGGNIGTPLIGYVDSSRKMDRLVVEVSSFQLDTIEKFKPQIAVLLNITPDHLDRYADFEAYVDAKGDIFKNQSATDTAVLNGSDPWVRRLCHRILAKKLFFTGRANNEQGADIHPESIYFHPGVLESVPAPASKDMRVKIELPRHRPQFQCRHILENVSAACLAALAAGASINGIQQALTDYSAQPHRMEYLGTIDGIHYYNDSKATNVDAVLRALECLNGPIVLIMGGRNKGYDFYELAEPVKQKVKTLILLGEAADDIAKALGHLTRSKKVAGMAEAVAEAHANALPEGTVLFSPACASFDMYQNYKERGESFRKEMQRLGKRTRK